jgi:cytochrome b6-f complex iron-sulfur subunit
MIGNQKTETNLDRREFLRAAWGFSLLGLMGQATIALVRFFKPRVVPGAFGTRVVAGQVDEFLPGTVSHVQQGRFYVSRLEDGGFLALWHRCTHLGCTVPWLEDEERFNCPCHSSIFNKVGEVISGPAPRPMDLFPIEIEAGQIVVDTSQPIERDSHDPDQVTRV